MMSLSENTRQTANLLAIEESELDYIAETSLAEASKSAQDEFEEDVDTVRIAPSRWGDIATTPSIQLARITSNIKEAQKPVVITGAETTGINAKNACALYH